MAVPYHTHTFEIPVATNAEAAAGVRSDVALTPSNLQSVINNTGFSQGYPTIDIAEAANILPVVHAIEVYGAATVGDGLGGLYIDTDNGASETFVSGDGRTWYLAADINPDRLTAATIALFATAAQGVLADGAAQKAQNLSDLANKGAARSNLSTPVHVADRAALKAISPAQDLGAVLRENPRQGLFYPRLISSLSATAAAARAADTGEYIYVTSTDDPLMVWIRQGAERRGFWTDSATPAYVHRFADRVMIGESVGFDCSTVPDPNTGAAWLHTIKPGATNGCGYMEIHGRVVATGPHGSGFVGATRLTGAVGIEGYGGIFHVRNESTNDKDAWGLYVDTVRGAATAGNMAGIELDIANCSGVTDARYLPHGFEGQSIPTAWSYGLAIASGGDVKVNPDALPVSYALGIINNGATFHTGIVFRNNALELDGAGYGEAIALATKHKIGWHIAAGEASYLTSTATTIASGVRALLIDNGVELRRNGNDQAFFRALTSSGAVNLLEIVATATGSGPIIRAATEGDTNKNVVIQPAGTGVLQVTYAATTAADIASNRRVRIRVAGADIDLLGVLV